MLLLCLKWTFIKKLEDILQYNVMKGSKFIIGIMNKYREIPIGLSRKIVLCRSGNIENLKGRYLQRVSKKYHIIPKLTFCIAEVSDEKI